MRYLYLAFGLALAITSCTKDVGAGNSPATDSLAATSYLNVAYGDDNQQRLDVYLPENRGADTRLVIIIHGGGWSGGDKSDFDSYITEFQGRLPGYAFANLNYRLVRESANFFPTQENDVKLAIEFLKEQASEYNISTDFIYLGISAGAHLAMLQAYKHSDVLQPKGVVSFFGPVDLEQLYLDSDSTIPRVLRTIMNATLEGNPDIFSSSSPLNYVTSGAAPTLMLHGDQDRLVPIQQAYMLRDKFLENGVSHELVVYPGQGHGWIGSDLYDSFSQVESFIEGLGN